MKIETDAGVLSVKVIEDHGLNKQISFIINDVKVNHLLPASDFKMTELSSLVFDGIEYFIFPVSLGNPHAVIIVDSLDSVDIPAVGSFVESYKWFPNKVNVEFIEIISQTNIRMRVWERGVGETNACGTGACASVIAAFHQKKVDSNVRVELLGGELTIDYDNNNSAVCLLGPTTFVFNSALNQ